MKSLVAYSSRTGKTAKVARAIFEVLPDPKAIFPAEDYDFAALGYWVDKGRPDVNARR